MSGSYLSLLILFAALGSQAQQKPVRIVFDVSSGDTLVQQAAIRHVSTMAKSYTNAKFEVVVYGNALPMVVKNETTVGKQLQLLTSNPNVSIKVCELTLKRENVTEAQLVQNVSPVPDAIIEIVTRQDEGWGYIKEAE